MNTTATSVRIMNPSIPPEKEVQHTLSFRIGAGSIVEMTTMVAPNLVPLDLAKKNSRKYTVQKTLTQIFEKGENIFFRFVELKGHGLVTLHIMGLIRLNKVWQFEKTEIDVQFYFMTKGKFFSPLLDNQPELKSKLAELIKKDKMIPTMDAYVEYVPLVNTVKWFNSFSQVGCIASAEGDVFFHLNNARFPYRHGCLKPGRKVNFKAVATTGKSFPFAAEWIELSD